MAEKNLLVGDRAFLPVIIEDSSDIRDHAYPIRCSYKDKGRGSLTSEQTFCVQVGSTDYLMTAEEVAGSLKTKADAMEVVSDSLQEENEELRAKLAEFKETIGKQSDKLRELQARIVELNEVNSSLGENRDALNNEAAVHMTSIHNLQVAVEVLAEKIFEMRCEQDG